MLIFILYFVFFLQRMDLGACNKIHDPALRADYENAAQTREFGYDVDVSINVKEEVVTLKKKQVS